MAGILVGVDTPHARDLVRGLLGNEGHQVRLARDGREVLRAYALECPDLLVLDVQLPDPGGLEVCRLLRAVDSQTPVLLLSPRCGEEEVAHALGTGADDFLVRPFGAREFAARVRALLRRAALPRRADAPDVPVFSLGACAVHNRELELRDAHGRCIALTPRECAILRYFATHPNEVARRGDLFDYAWGHGALAYSRTIDTHVCVLRRKLAGSGCRIESVSGMGYRLRVETPAA